MIESFKISNVATFDEVGIEISNLKKYNFIYGANGSGKTTISDFLLFNQNPNFDTCSVTWKDKNPIKTLVYNRDFKNKIIFQDRDMPGIFTMSEESSKAAEEVKNIEEKIAYKEKFLANLQKTLKEKKDDLVSKKENFENDCWKKKKSKAFEKFQKAFSGYNNNKKKFAEKIVSTIEKNPEKEFKMEELEKRFLALYDDTQQTLDNINKIEYLLTSFENHLILKKNIIGKNDVDISKLITQLDNADWVNQGRKYVKDEICPFCQQHTLKDSLKQQFDDFFDETYNDSITKLKEVKENYNLKTDSLLEDIKTKKNYLRGLKIINFDLKSYEEIEDTIKSKISENKQIISSKLDTPSKKVSIKSLSDKILKLKVISDCSDQINKFNEIIKNRTEQKPQFIDDLFVYIAFLSKEIYLMYKQEISRFKTAENNLTKKIVQTKKTLESLQKEKDKKITEITGVKPSIEKINKLLIAFGFTNFKLSSAEKPGFYKIVRDSKEEAKSTLSEGELTFITFLYYYQLTQGDLQAENVNEDKILIIDDPISSLDSNVLHIVSSIIKYLMEQVKSNNSNLKQLILLTHNIYFHKEVTYKVDNSTFWILKKIQNKTKIKRFDKNPIKSSYELLWSEIKNNTESIALQNNMRRILEYYFTIIGNHDSLKHCVNLFDSPEEKNIARALILWTNDGSHSFDDELFIQGFDDTSESYNKVFKDLFYKTGHDGHYNMMMRLENKEIDKSLHNSVS